MRALLNASADAGILAQFWTGLAFSSRNTPTNILPKKIANELRRRAYPENIAHRFNRVPFRDTCRLIVNRLGWQFLTKHETGILSIDSVYRDLDEKLSLWILDNANRHSAQIVYCYEDGARHTFRAAKECMLQCFYDLPIGYWRAGHEIYQEEAARKPEWASTLTGLRDSVAKLTAKDEELALADRIFVASTFTKRTLEKYPAKLGEITTIPYGFPQVCEPLAEWRPQGEKDRPLRALFVGGLSQRKGLSDLFEAVFKAGSSVELTVIGQKVGECAILDTNLQKCRWIPSLSHPELLAQMEKHDVLIFPSLFEGFGLVLTEAMARGMAVITTPHTAGPDIISSGIDGYIVPIRRPDSIASLLVDLFEDREKLASIRTAARRRASLRPWSVYGNDIVSAFA